MPSFNPQAWQNYDLSNKNQSRDFLRQLSNWCIQIQTPSVLAGLLNGSALVTNSALQYVSFNPGNVSTNQTVECVNAFGIVSTLQISTAVNLTITLNHVANGVLVVVRFVNGASTTQTFKLAYTNPSGVSGNAFAFAGASFANVTTTGLPLGTGQQILLVGAGDATNSMYLSET